MLETDRQYDENGQPIEKKEPKERDPIEDKVTKGTNFVNLEVQAVNKLQTGLQSDLNKPFYVPNMEVLKKQLRLQRGKGDFGITKEEAEEFDVGMVLDVPAVLRKEKDDGRKQVDIGLPVNDFHAAPDSKGPPEAPDEFEGTPNVSVDGDTVEKEEKKDDFQDKKMKQ